MNNKLIVLLLLFVSLFCFNSVVYAEVETNGNVMAKYVIENGGNFYEKTLNQNNEINMSLDDRAVNIKSNNSLDNQTSIIMIPVTTEAFTWLTSDYEDKTNLKAYYVDFYKDNEKISLNGNVNIKINSCESCNLEKVYFYDLNKNIIDSTNNVNNNMNFNINKSGYLLFHNNILKTVNLDISSYGNLVADNKTYTGNTTFYSDSNIKEVAIRPNSGYVIDKILLNNVDVTNSVLGNFLELTLNDTNNLEVTFKKDVPIEVEHKLTITGTATLNGNPISNTKVELHSNTLITYTDSEGRFVFKDVESGDHTISFGEEDNIIGYSVIKMVTTDSRETDVTINDNIVEVKVNNKSKIVNLDLSLEKDMKINPSNVYTIIKGDVNCDGLVNVTDLVQLRMYLARIKTLTDRGLEAANLKDDNKIDITDLIKLRRYLAGLEKL